jgi:RNA polymerase sigma-70 factor (family 1)
MQYLQIRICRFEDQHAYKELFTTLYPDLFQFVLGILKRKEPAEEVVSDLFMKIWEKRKTLTDIRNLRVYCFVAARHLSINQLEKQKRFHNVALEQYANLVHVAPDPEQCMINTEMLLRINSLVESLPPRCKMIFTLVKEFDFKYREAAEILQVSEKTIENQLAIAIKKISKAINFDVRRSVPVITGHLS